MGRRQRAGGPSSAAEFQLSSRSTRPGQPEIGGQLGFSGVELRYLDTMPPGHRAERLASLAGNSLGSRSPAGRTGEVDLSRGDAVLTNLFVEQPTRLKRRLPNQRSTVPAAMRLLDAEPVGVAQGHRAVGRQCGLGQQRPALELGLPLLDKIPPERIRFKATTQLTDVELREARPGYDLAARASGGGGGARGDRGQGRRSGQWRADAGRRAREHAAGARGPAHLKASGSLDAAGARALAVDWPEEIGGAVGFDATWSRRATRLRTVDVAARSRPCRDPAWRRPC